MKKTKLIRVTFEPDGAEVYVPPGTLLSRAAAACGHAVEMPCGGMGTCGKCKVIVSGACGDPSAAERAHLSESEIATGSRLACRTKVIGEITVTIPEISRSRVQKILSKGVLRDTEVLSGVSKVCLQLTPPSLNDERAEFERLVDGMKARDISLVPNIHVVQRISHNLRAADYNVTAVVYGDELIAVEPGDTASACYGIAYDLGSTTVVGYLMDLRTGEDVAVASVMNPQVIYGDDLVSRISFATTQEDGAKVLQDAAVDALRRIADNLAQMAGVSLDHVYKATVVGNTCMTHLLLGIDSTSLGQSPYVPSVCSDISLTAGELGLPFCPEAKVVVLPNVAGFVGSDLVAVLLSSMFDDDGRTRLAVDIGTNGEMALFHNGDLYVCSAAAGPAFEGAGIGCGMRGGPGAIDSVRIGETVKITTIDNRRPIGICGSGLVDAVAQLLEAGLIDEGGRLLSPEEAPHASPAVLHRLEATDSGVQFVLATKQESGSGKPVVLTHGDIRRLQLAKGSIAAAIATLIKAAGAAESDLNEVLLAGAFGNYIAVESAIRIGLIPAVDRDKVVSIGNAAGSGARLALLSDREMDLARDLARRARHLELAVSPDYQMELMEKMMFPPAADAAPTANLS